MLLTKYDASPYQKDVPDIHLYLEDSWFIQHTVRELYDNYELMLNAYEDVADKLYG